MGGVEEDYDDVIDAEQLEEELPLITGTKVEYTTGVPADDHTVKPRSKFYQSPQHQEQRQVHRVDSPDG